MNPKLADHIAARLAAIEDPAIAHHYETLSKVPGWSFHLAANGVVDERVGIISRAVTASWLTEDIERAVDRGVDPRGVLDAIAPIFFPDAEEPVPTLVEALQFGVVPSDLLDEGLDQVFVVLPTLNGVEVPAVADSDLILLFSTLCAEADRTRG